MSENNTDLNEVFEEEMDDADVITVPIDETLSNSGEAADAAAVGAALALKADKDELPATIKVNNQPADNQGLILIDGTDIPISDSNTKTLAEAIEEASEMTAATIPMTGEAGAATIGETIGVLQETVEGIAGNMSADKIPMSEAEDAETIAEAIGIIADNVEELAETVEGMEQKTADKVLMETGSTVTVKDAIETLDRTAVKSVNRKLPDASGDVDLSVVPLAENLQSDKLQSIEGEFTLRTTGGTGSVSDGKAYPQHIYGNSRHDGFVAEVLNLTVIPIARTEPDEPITATIDRDTFLEEVEDSDTINLYYTTEWSEDPADYGVTVTGDPVAGDQITIVYVKEVRGTIVVAEPERLVGTGWNLFNYNAGYARVVKYSETYGYKIGGTFTSIAFAASLTDDRISLLPNIDGLFSVPGDGYVFVTGGNNTDTYILTTWSDWIEGPSTGYWEAYRESGIDLSAVVETYFPYGMLKVGTVRDEIDLVAKRTISRIERMVYNEENRATAAATGRAYDFDENNIYVVRAEPVLNAITIDSEYSVSEHGLEWFTETELPLDTEILYGKNLRDKLERNVLTISAQTLTEEEKSQVRTNIGAMSQAEGDTKLVAPTEAGTAGQLLHLKEDGGTEWTTQGTPTDAQVGTAVSAWLDAHPEATTTVEDGAISRAKLNADLKEKTDAVPDLKGALDPIGKAEAVRNGTRGNIGNAKYVTTQYVIPYEDALGCKVIINRKPASGKHYELFVCTFSADTGTMIENNNNIISRDQQINLGVGANEFYLKKGQFDTTSVSFGFTIGEFNGTTQETLRNTDFPDAAISVIYDYKDVKYIEDKIGNVPFGSTVQWQIDLVNTELDELLDEVSEKELVTLSIQSDGYYDNSGVFHSDLTRRYAIVTDVVGGEQYSVDTHLGTVNISAILYFNDTSFIDKEKTGTGTAETVTDYRFTIPLDCNKIIVQSATTTAPVLYKVITSDVPKFYTKAESDSRYEMAGTINGYGVKWSINDNDDLGSRFGKAEGLNATIGIGGTDGSSDFDDIYPWSEIKRCNIKINANGAAIVTFEGETGFALDGSNGDVFVRIPKFTIERGVKDGYEYRIIGSSNANTHEAFIENGKELDEIFIGAFESYIDNNSKLRSIAGVIPTSNTAPSSFLTSAKANGNNYSLYDNRCVDAIWCLMAVEFGKRNTNRIIGYGVADLMQPVSNAVCIVRESATNTNTVKVNKMNNTYKAFMPVGSNITICHETQYNIIAQRHIIAVEDVGDTYTQFTFDGDPITVVADDDFIGSAAFDTNRCESVSTGALSWHTGRCNFISGSNTQNPIRYRWIENPVGNLWHYLPDVTFNALQMYVCKNMADYEFFKHDGAYKPIGAVFLENDDNGNKLDVTGSNYWITSLADETFAKAVLFGRTYDKSLTSDKAFGGYYYLYHYLVTVLNGGGFDHLWRCNMLTQRAWARDVGQQGWYLYGARMMYKEI